LAEIKRPSPNPNILWQLRIVEVLFNQRNSAPRCVTAMRSVGTTSPMERIGVQPHYENIDVTWQREPGSECIPAGMQTNYNTRVSSRSPQVSATALQEAGTD